MCLQGAQTMNEKELRYELGIRLLHTISVHLDYEYEEGNSEYSDFIAAHTFDCRGFFSGAFNFRVRYNHVNK